ncbi:uncharacterized protein LOC132278193 [Cornus florida]|uniref:uncharacterized protein LOC132278193 n=1 Tax=Cornus florida TaxID=4283 RepID=UPI0028994146|nr:uncharacterized protein LOC132278193 [Cornus florida]
MVEKCHLVDLGYYGYPFSWCNQRDGRANVRERLDRALATHEWGTHFTYAFVTNIRVFGSDHSAIMLSLTQQRVSKGRCFRFDARWLTSEECAKIVADSWQTSCRDTLQFQLKNKITTCRQSLKNWSQRSQWNSQFKI